MGRDRTPGGPANGRKSDYRTLTLTRKQPVSGIQPATSLATSARALKPTQNVNPNTLTSYTDSIHSIISIAFSASRRPSTMLPSLG
jgi:hypothetical protein